MQTIAYKCADYTNGIVYMHMYARYVSTCSNALGRFLP